MAILLYSLRNVPTEEADAMRDLLNRHAIDYYESPQGAWGISAAAFWLKDEEQESRARQLLDEFHESWGAAQRERQRQLAQEGKVRTFLGELRQRPLQIILYLAAALLILYLSTKPFISLGID